jgi:predicted dehydrogenase
VDKALGVGIAGISWVAHEHIRAFQQNPHTRVVALQSASEQNAAAARDRHGLNDAQIYTDYERMLADPRVDIVAICSTNERHANQAILGAGAGKHLLIEKPVALTLPTRASTSSPSAPPTSATPTRRSSAQELVSTCSSRSRSH